MPWQVPIRYHGFWPAKMIVVNLDLFLLTEEDLLFVPRTVEITRTT